MKIHEDKFSYGIFLIVSIISISMLAFLNEDKNITGYVIAGESANYESASALAEFNSLNSLAQLSPGLYYVYADGYVYSVDDYSRLLVGKEWQHRICIGFCGKWIGRKELHMK